MRNLTYSQSIRFSGNPRLFVKTDGEISPSSIITGGNGIDCGYGTIVTNPLTIEVKVNSESCRANFNNQVSTCFNKLSSLLSKKEQTRLDFSSSVTIDSSKRLSIPVDNLPDEMSNIYEALPESPLKRKRGKMFLYADGPIIIRPISQSMEETIKNVKDFIPLLDIFVGNTSVLLDRDVINPIRRKTRNKAGEFSLKPYGVHYNTLTNFWVRSQQLCSLVMGMARFAAHVAEQSPKGDYIKTINELVPREDILNAIQNNDYDLAKHNFDRLTPFIIDLAGYYTDSYPINSETIKEFNYFVNKGIDYWFSGDRLKHWTLNYIEGHGQGIENFLANFVRKDMKDNRPELSNKTVAEIWAKFNQ